MKTFFFKSFIIAAIAFSAALAASAQPADVKVKPPRGHELIGEVLRYDAKVNKILRGISVAELTMSVVAASDPSQVMINAEAVSKGTLLKIFRYSFLQQYGATLDASFRTLKSTKHDVQKERVRDSEAVFDYGRKMVTFVETDPKDASRAPRRIASEIGDQVVDMISAVYYLRLETLAIGKRYELSVSDSGLVYKIPVNVTAREMQKTVLGNVWCYRLEPEVFGPGRLIEQEGKMVIWMTDDVKHTPVRSQIDADIGKIDIKLKLTPPAK